MAMTYGSPTDCFDSRGCPGAFFVPVEAGLFARVSKIAHATTLGFFVLEFTNSDKEDYEVVACPAHLLVYSAEWGGPQRRQDPISLHSYYLPVADKVSLYTRQDRLSPFKLRQDILIPASYSPPWHTPSILVHKQDPSKVVVLEDVDPNQHSINCANWVLKNFSPLPYKPIGVCTMDFDDYVRIDAER
ncbi:hypothetical protein C8J56DRAFT_953703 [Mycena floridula]|nr:hypothetical protein C8J56DRAFT_953703 [Mycena floridula]